MKLTKERLVQIIKEEMEMMELDAPSDVNTQHTTSLPSPAPETDQPAVKDKATLAKEKKC